MSVQRRPFDQSSIYQGGKHSVILNDDTPKIALSKPLNKRKDSFNNYQKLIIDNQSNNFNPSDILSVNRPATNTVLSAERTAFYEFSGMNITQDRGGPGSLGLSYDNQDTNLTNDQKRGSNINHYDISSVNNQSVNQGSSFHVPQVRLPFIKSIKEDQHSSLKNPERQTRNTNDAAIADELERKAQKIVLLTDNNFQKLKMKKKNGMTQRQKVQTSILDKNNDTEALQRNEKYITNLHSNLTVNGQKQELILPNQNPNLNQSPDIPLQSILKKKYIRGITKSQEPGVSDSQNSTSRENYNLSLQQIQNIIQPQVVSKYNHQFSNLRTAVRASNSMAITDEQININHQFNIKLEQRDALRNKFLNMHDKYPYQSVHDHLDQAERRVATPKNMRESSVQNTHRQTPQENARQTNASNYGTEKIPISGIGFQSPSLEYKKKKKDYYHQSSVTHGKNNLNQPSQLNSQYISFQKQNSLVNSGNNTQTHLDYAQQKLASNMNSLIMKHHMNRGGNPHLSFAQVLKNMNNKINYNQVPVTNIENSDSKNDNKQGQERQFQILIKSSSQDIESINFATAHGSQKVLGMQQNNPFDSNQSVKNENQNLKKNFNNEINTRYTYNHIEKKKVLNADELYEMAKAIKQQNKLKQQQQAELQSTSVNRSQDNITQNQTILNLMKSSNQNQDFSKNNPKFLGALNIQKIQQNSQKNNGDGYQMKIKDMQLVGKYSKKSQNLLQQYEEYVQTSLANHYQGSRNQYVNLNNSKRSARENIKTGGTIQKINQSVDFSVTAGVTAQQSFSAQHLIQIQEIQPLTRTTTEENGKKENHQRNHHQQSQQNTQCEKNNRKRTTIDEEQFSKEDIYEGTDEEQKEVTKQQQNAQRSQQFHIVKSQQQQQKAKQKQQIIQEIDRLLYGYLWDKEAKIPNNKKKLEIDFHDMTNGDFQNHPINKAIRQMSLMSNLMFKTKEYGQLQSEIFNRCQRFFGIVVPKQYRNDLIAMMKNKEFLTHVKERMHVVLFNCINKVNGIQDQQQVSQPKYVIGNGNNSLLVKSVFKSRQWWVQNEKEEFNESHFIWTQWLKERHIQSLPTTSKKMEASNQQDPQEENLFATKIYNKMQSNHNLSDKKHLFQNMREYYQQIGIDPFKILPLTYVIENGLNDVEFDKFEEKFKFFASKQGFENVWIIKPGEDTNRGCGIIVSKDFNEIRQLVRDKASRGVDKTAILQKYIENPLLINKRKFDMRCYGLLTSINGNLMGYFYQDGYLRTSCKEFNVNNLNNKFIHLTNDAIQKFSDDYGKFENANKLSFQDFDKYFENNGEYDLRFARDFLPQIRTVIRDSFRAVESKIDPEKRHNTFEIFGYDFMIDDEYQLKLIEANTNPCLEVCCPLLARIIPNLVDSAFKIAVDPLFPPPSAKKNAYAWGGGTEVLNDIKFELVFQSQSNSS
ncbi:tubulin-tyrosine ligase family protein [Stylonychia lemnae]|uniref:Tubulin-tyrosine ligase family protein n=1 Tax=Stylonychia lemnae TaxID=5949 RepID=A0A078AK37_STYLE|nr:tubulin-tyrosine ligase family protein [Stylonychia lemnae]|eukprot:CDW81168.1 tubulin-tyrosine ligase family protein [Stylonychia lemnae]